MLPADAAHNLITAWEDYKRRLAQNEADAANGSTPDAASLEADRKVLAGALADFLDAALNRQENHRTPEKEAASDERE